MKNLAVYKPTFLYRVLVRNMFEIDFNNSTKKYIEKDQKCNTKFSIKF